MRRLSLTSLCGLASIICLAQHPLINEVVPGGGGAPDWIELYNPGARTFDLLGCTFVTPGRTHRISASLPIAAHGRLVIWCDRHPEAGPEHLDLKLPREGGSVLLIDRDRRTVRDVYSWRGLPSGVSLGRLSDGAREWGYFTGPTPGSPNGSAHGARSLLSAPAPLSDHGTIVCVPEEGSVLRYTLDGRIPDQGSPVFNGPLTLPASSVITLRAFADDAATNGKTQSMDPTCASKSAKSQTGDCIINGQNVGNTSNQTGGAQPRSHLPGLVEDGHVFNRVRRRVVEWFRELM